MKKSALLVASVALAVLLAGGSAVAQSTSEVTTYYKAVDKWGSEGSANGQFNHPGGVAVDSEGNVYVADIFNHRVQKFTSGGTFLTKWGTEGSANGQFAWPSGIAIDSKDNVYVVDRDNNQVQKFTSDGTFLTKWGTEGSANGQFNEPMRIAVDSEDNVYVSEFGNARVQKFTSSGQFVTKWGSFGEADGQFQNPVGIAFDSLNNFYVSEASSDRVQKFAEVPLETDTVAPVTQASFSPSPHYNQDITVTLNVVDVNGSGAKEITYQASGAQEIASTTVAGWSARFTISAVGRTTITYFATDLAGNTEQPQSTTVVIDKHPPRVQSTVPLDGATGIAPSGVVKATFSERMIASSITNSPGRLPTFRLVKEGATTPIAATVTYDVQTMTATLDPSAPLDAGATYKATVGYRAQDLATNYLDQKTSVEGFQTKRWSFTVGS